MDSFHLVNLEHSGALETFRFISMIPRSGKQGILGILRSVKDDTNYIFKISQYFNYTCRQEHQVMRDLEELKEYCPHFCKTKGIYRARINPNFREATNVFDLKNVKTPIEVDVLLMEYIEKGIKFCRYILNNKVDEEVLFSIMKQTMMSIVMAQRDVKLTHYDLHSNNILITETDPNTLHYYILDDGRSYIVPTYGFVPTIIDFGFSYSKGMEGKPLYGALAHTNVGFMSSCYDDCGDSKLFLSTVSWEMDINRGRRIHKTFRRDCKDLLKGLEIDMDSGWDDTEKEESASDYLISLINSEASKSRFFDECGHFAVDIIQYLIRLPLRPRNVPEIYQAFILVRNEFMKLEKEIGSTFFLLYIFKSAVEAVGDTKDEYMHGDEKKALYDFRHRMYSVIESIAKYARAKLDYEKLYVGLLGMARASEGLLYKVVSSRMKDKERQKRRMDVRDLGDMHHLIYYKYQDDYDLTKDSKIVVFDQMRKQTYKLELSDEDIKGYNSTKKLMDRCDWLFEYCDAYAEHQFSESQSDSDICSSGEESYDNESEYNSDRD